MFSASAELYDLIYSDIKDYRAEAASVAQRIRQAVPGARTILDVACGTGEHARVLSRDHGFAVDGLDFEPGFVDVARAKNPAGRFFRGDLTSFALDGRYDAVLCLFSSIAYARTSSASPRRSAVSGTIWARAVSFSSNPGSSPISGTSGGSGRTRRARTGWRSYA